MSSNVNGGGGVGDGSGSGRGSDDGAGARPSQNGRVSRRNGGSESAGGAAVNKSVVGGRFGITVARVGDGTDGRGRRSTSSTAADPPGQRENRGGHPPAAGGTQQPQQSQSNTVEVGGSSSWVTLVVEETIQRVKDNCTLEHQAEMTEKSNVIKGLQGRIQVLENQVEQVTLEKGELQRKLNEIQAMDTDKIRKEMKTGLMQLENVNGILGESMKLFSNLLKPPVNEGSDQAQAPPAEAGTMEVDAAADTQHTQLAPTAVEIIIPDLVTPTSTPENTRVRITGTPSSPSSSSIGYRPGVNYVPRLIYPPAPATSSTGTAATNGKENRRMDEQTTLSQPQTVQSAGGVSSVAVGPQPTTSQPALPMFRNVIPADGLLRNRRVCGVIQSPARRRRPLASVITRTPASSHRHLRKVIVPKTESLTPPSHPAARRRQTRGAQEVVIFHMPDAARSKPQDGIFYCSCGTKSSTLMTQQRHIRYFNEAWNFRCPDCSKRFYSTNYLRRHMIKVHEKILPAGVAGCTRCGQIFDSHREMLFHRRTMACVAAPPPTPE